MLRKTVSFLKFFGNRSFPHEKIAITKEALDIKKIAVK